MFGSIVSIISLFMIVSIAGLLQTVLPYGLAGDPISSSLIGFFIIIFLVLSLISLTFGILSLVKNEENMFLNIVGITISTVTTLGSIFIILFGMIIG